MDLRQVKSKSVLLMPAFLLGLWRVRFFRIGLLVLVGMSVHLAYFALFLRSQPCLVRLVKTCFFGAFCAFLWDWRIIAL